MTDLQAGVDTVRRGDLGGDEWLGLAGVDALVADASAVGRRVGAASWDNSGPDEDEDHAKCPNPWCHADLGERADFIVGVRGTYNGATGLADG